jgi:molecular chaperone DnaK
MKAVNFGIDLGTTNSLIAKYEDGQVILYKNPIGHKESLASVVAFRKDRILVGDKAREFLLKDPVNVFGGFKRRMGTDDRFYVVNIDENITPVELSAYVLRELKQFVHSGEKIEAAVITIPASFDTMQANATKDAGIQAGFREVFLLQEPIAASLAYFNNQKEEKNGYWLVYDLGGGTFDIALVEIKEGEMKVKDHEGNNFLGGTDFDALIVEQLIVPIIIDKTKIDDFYDQLIIKYGRYEKLYYKLLYIAEEVKKELSFNESSQVEFSAEIDGTDYDFFFPVLVSGFNDLIAPKVDETLKMIRTIFERNNLEAADIHEIILVGGSTFIPCVRNRLKGETGITVNSSIDPTAAVAVGAAFYAANKYYEPGDTNLSGLNVDNNPQTTNTDTVTENKEQGESFQLNLGYSKMSKESEEVLLVKTTGSFENYTCRIQRNGGGFDTGIVPLRSKFTEFLPLLPNISNTFKLRIFDANHTEIQSAIREIVITQGKYTISGQPLPKDICIEVDDSENNTTRLDVVFEKNSILPLRKTLYKGISKTINKGSNESIIINILEGDRFARSVSNLPIGNIEISGKQLTSDLIKGSDIEIRISISDNRELNVETYLVMTQQEFKSTFSIAEKHINVSRLKEQYIDLENEMRKSMRQFNSDENSIWIIQAENLLKEIENYKSDLFKLKDNDSTDKRYVIAEAVSRISREFDNIGGYSRLEALQSDYIRTKEYLEELFPSVDIEKESLHSQYRKIIENESHILRSRSPSILKHAIDLLKDLRWRALWNTNTYIVSMFYAYKSCPPEVFTNFKAAQAIFASGEKAVEEQRFLELRRLINNLYHLRKDSMALSGKEVKNFKGTGIN